MLYKPTPGTKWEAIGMENWRHLPLDTIYMQGLDPGRTTGSIVREFARYGSIVCFVRYGGNDNPEKRKYMWIQFDKWESAWHAVFKSHGKIMDGQDIDVEIANRTLNNRRGGMWFVYGDEVMDREVP